MGGAPYCESPELIKGNVCKAEHSICAAGQCVCDICGTNVCICTIAVARLCRAGPRGRARGRTTLGVHPLSWLLSNNRLEKVSFVSVPHTSSNRLLLSIQDKGCTPSVAHFLALPLGPALHNVSIELDYIQVWIKKNLTMPAHLVLINV